MDALLSCSFFCEPATTISVGAELGGSAFLGRATLDGKTYTDIGGFVDTAAFVRLSLAGTIRLPEIGPSPVVITAPFTVGILSLFRTPFEPSGASDEVPLRGGGVVTLMLTPESQSPMWTFTSLRYDFVQTPTPEPGTLVLVGGALAGAALRARKRCV